MQLKNTLEMLATGPAVPLAGSIDVIASAEGLVFIPDRQPSLSQNIRVDAVRTSILSALATAMALTP